MKKYLLIAMFFFIGTVTHSQVIISLLLGDKLNSPGLEFGLEGGVNLTNISEFETGSTLPNFNLGFYFDIKVKNQWYFYTGCQVKSSFGTRDISGDDLLFLEAESYEWEGKYNQKLNAFMLPFLANYKFKNHFYVEAGPQLGLVYRSYLVYSSSEDNREVKIKDFNRDLINKINGGLAAGLGYKLQKGTGMTIGVRYYQGLTDVFKDNPGSRHNSFHIKVNVPVGAGKAKQSTED